MSPTELAEFREREAETKLHILEFTRKKIRRALRKKKITKKLIAHLHSLVDSLEKINNVPPSTLVEDEELEQWMKDHAFSRQDCIYLK